MLMTEEGEEDRPRGSVKSPVQKTSSSLSSSPEAELSPEALRALLRSVGEKTPRNLSEEGDRG